MSVTGEGEAGVLEWEPKGPSVLVAQNFLQEVVAWLLACLCYFELQKVGSWVSCGLF